MKLGFLENTLIDSIDSGETMCKVEMDNMTNETTRKQLKKKSVSKKTTAKYKKAPGAPRRFKSAFIFFSTQKHKEIRTGLGEKGSKEKTTNVAKMVSGAWKSLSAEDREYWDDLARRDKERYEVEKSLYDGPWKVPAQKASKDPNAPKRPMSAFLSYSNSKRSNVKRENPGLMNAEVSRVLAAMWKQCTDDEKKSYIDEEFSLRQKYKIAIAEWRANELKEKEVQRKMREEMAVRTMEAHKRQMHDQDVHADEMARHHRDHQSSSLPSLQMPPHLSGMNDRADGGMGRASLQHHEVDPGMSSNMDLLGHQQQMPSHMNSPYGGYSNDSSMSSLLGSSPYNAAQSLFDHQQALMSANLQQQQQQSWGGRDSRGAAGAYNSAPGGGLAGSRNAALLDALTAQQNMSSQRYGSAAGRYGSNYGADEYQGRAGDSGFNNFFDPSSGGY